MPPKSVEDLVLAIQRLLEDGGLRMRLGAYSREKAVKEFDINPIIRDYLSIYGVSYEYKN